MDRTPLIITAFLITLVAFFNLLRFLLHIPIAIGTITLPGWTGAIAFILLGMLAAWSFRALFDYPSFPSDL